MKTLAEAKQIYESAIKSRQYKTWREQAKKDFDFYEGRQFTAEEEQVLRKRKQPIIPVNKIAVNIDTVVGQEVRTRTSIGYKPRSFNPIEQVKASALTSQAQFIQERENTAYKLSQRNKDRYICGIGWLHREIIDGKLCYSNPSPLEMVWDVSDDSRRMEDQRYFARHKWVAVDVLKSKYPKSKSAIEKYAKSKTRGKSALANEGVMVVRDQDYNGVNDPGTYFDDTTDRMQIVDMEYKVPTKAYQVITNFKSLNAEGEEVNKEVFITFDEEQAKEEAARDENNRIIDGAITEIMADKIYNIVFCDEIELYHELSEVQNFELGCQPSIFHRKLSGAPMGLVERAIPVQQEYNKRRSKAMHLMNSNRIVMDVDAVDDPRAAAMEMAKPDGVLLKKPGKDFQLIDQNDREAGQQLSMMQRAEREIDIVMGVSAESRGEVTNATSGVAINQRQQASVGTLQNAFDDHGYDKRRFGKDLLSAMQATLTQEMVVEILDDDQQAQTVTINKRQDTASGSVTTYDVKTAELDVYVEEIPDYSAPPEEIAANVQQIMMNGQGAMLSQEAILGVLGIPPNHAKRVAAAFKTALQASPEQAQEAPNPAAGV